MDSPGHPPVGDLDQPVGWDRVDLSICPSCIFVDTPTCDSASGLMETLEMALEWLIKLTADGKIGPLEI